MLKRKHSADNGGSASSSTTSDSNPRAKKIQKQEEARDVARYINKQRTLVLSSRGITHRDRHLLADLRDLLPHAKKDVKFDAKGQTADKRDIKQSFYLLHRYPFRTCLLVLRALVLSMV